MLDAHHQHDAALGIEQIGLARSGREPKQREHRGGRELDPGERGDLRWHQQWQKRDEGERRLVADISQGQEKGDGDTNQHRHKRRQRARLERMEQRGLRCRRAPLLQQNAEKLTATARQEGLNEQARQRQDPERHDIDRERDDQDPSASPCRSLLAGEVACRMGTSAPLPKFVIHRGNL
jgi:hypothetical protein